jgi:2-oxoglutarate ferredoxin oxidoreductase subunit alpha
MGVPGEDGGQYVATGISHDEYGHPAYTPDIVVPMHKKRWAKLEPLRDGLVRHARHGDEQPQIAIIGFGSTFGPVWEAIDLLAPEGHSIGAFYPRVLGPFPVGAVKAFTTHAKRVIVPEVNFTGQLARLIRAEVGIQVESHTKCDGLPFTAEDIHDIVTQGAAQ